MRTARFGFRESSLSTPPLLGGMRLATVFPHTSGGVIQFSNNQIHLSN